MPIFVLGGAALGATLGFQVFGDDQLRRLARQHRQDRDYNIES